MKKWKTEFESVAKRVQMKQSKTAMGKIRLTCAGSHPHVDGLHVGHLRQPGLYTCRRMWQCYYQVLRKNSKCHKKSIGRFSPNNLHNRCILEVFAPPVVKRLFTSYTVELLEADFFRLIYTSLQNVI